MSYFRDSDFQRRLVSFLCRDRNFLRTCGVYLDPDDFKPKRDEGPELWIIASAALEYWRKYREPIGGMLRSEMLDHARQTQLSERQRERLLDLSAKILDKHHLVAADAVADKVLSYKRERAKEAAVRRIIELQESGMLTDQKWLKICLDAVEKFGGGQYEAKDFFKTLEDRVTRRQLQTRTRYPYLMIEPLDERTRAIARGHLGLLMAFLGVGKSLGLIHIGLALLLQAYNVMHITLEDTKEEVEDRLDAAITGLPTQRLSEMPRRVRKRFVRFNRLVRSQFKIIDGTENGFSVGQIEELWERERNRSFVADAVIVDYDNHVIPPRQHKERRFEFDDIYRDLRRFAARRGVFLWTAAQTGRQTEERKIVSSSTISEDIGKMQKTFFALGIGRGEWGEKSRYLWVAKSKFGRDRFGFNIMTDLERGLFYDRSATADRAAAETAEKEREEESEHAK